MQQKPTKKTQPLTIPKPIIVTAKLLEATSPKLAARFAKKIFTTPIKFKLPKREENMDRSTRQELINVPVINKKIVTYHYGTSLKKVLLVHGWSGRGTQLHSIADRLVKSGYSTVSFDAPAHGKAPGKKSDMTEFIAAIMELEKLYGPFEYAVGHSLGAMAVLNAIKRGLKVSKAVTIGSGDVIRDIMEDFTRKLGMNIDTGELMIKRFEKKFGEEINSYSAYVAAKDIKVPVLMFHDHDDDDVPVTAATHIYQHLEKGELVLTRGLGHRKILGDNQVIKKIMQFLNDEKDTNATAGTGNDSLQRPK